MIRFLIQKKFAATVELFLDKAAPELKSLVSVLHYEEAVLGGEPAQGTYVFTDLENPAPGLRTRVHDLFRRLSQVPDLRILNNPLEFLQRTAFLKMLRERGINDYSVHTFSECLGPIAFPVFIRWADDHGGPRSPLLHTRWALFSRLAWMTVLGRRSKLLVVEFLDTSDQEGIFRKYGAFRVGERIVPRHLFHGREWMVKVGTALKSQEFLEEELEYIRANPHADELMGIFRAAGIEYGRIDYSVRKGRLQIWEINTNPTIGCISAPGNGSSRRAVHAHFLEAFSAALRDLDRAGQSAWDRNPPSA